MGIKSIALATTTLILSTSVNASIISYGGYTHDTTTDIVTGNGLEWLQWDRTLGESINSIQSQLNTIEGGGWTVASNVDMAQLFNSFDFGLTFDADENTGQSVYTDFSVGDDQYEIDRLFISMFGDTYAAANYSYGDVGDELQRSLARFGLDLDGDQYINYAYVNDDYTVDSVTSEGEARIHTDTRQLGEANDLIGVALVREVSTVPVPAAAWLFCSGLLGLIGVARRKA